MIERTDNPDFGYHAEFKGTNFVEIWAGDRGLNGVQWQFTHPKCLRWRGLWLAARSTSAFQRGCLGGKVKRVTGLKGSGNLRGLGLDRGFWARFRLPERAANSPIADRGQ